MVIKAKTQEAYRKACNLPVAFPLNETEIDIDPDTFHMLNPDDYILEEEGR